MIYQGDSLEILAAFVDDNSIDAIVCDPPYGLSDHSPEDTAACLAAWAAGEEYRPNKRGFMGKTWDSWVPGPEIWRECFRVLKPGGHIIAFAGSRTHDLMSIALRLAGFECRDTVMWVYGSGFPKSMDVSKAIDATITTGGSSMRQIRQRAMGNSYEPHRLAGTDGFGVSRGGGFGADESRDRSKDAALHTEAARQWQGWGTALKPAFEPALLFRKPLIGTVAANVLAHGTGGLNIDGCRVEGRERTDYGLSKSVRTQGSTYGTPSESADFDSSKGRFPANLIHDGSDEVVALFPDSNGSGGSVPNVKISGYGDGAVGTGKSEYLGGERTKVNAGSGSAARFFYSPKCSKKDREDGNHHPTVKPTDLMRYLCRLVTPPGGTVLDPFAGSGSTGKAAILEGFQFIGIEREAEYVEIARARIAAARKSLDL